MNKRNENGNGAGEIKKIALIGNPNVGKSVIFGLLTGKYVVVSNYPGTTVEVARGKTTLGGNPVEVIDTPGANSLLPMSDDERVTRDILLNENIGSAVLVADTKNLRRALIVALQIIEMKIPFVIALNMTDESASRGIEVDPKILIGELGIEAVPTVATRKQGIDKLISGIAKENISGYEFTYDEHIEQALGKISGLFEGHRMSARSIALMMLAGDQSLIEWASKHLSPQQLATVSTAQLELSQKYGQSVSYAISQRRRQIAESIEARAMKRSGEIPPGLSHKLGELMMHPVWGWGVLFAALWITYKFVGSFGAGTLVDLLETGLFEGIVNPAMIKAVNFILPWEGAAIVRDALVGRYGMITVALTYSVAIILPIVTTFFLVFGVLEDSGYLPRLAVMSNRAFKQMGLNGKAVLPMILGLGCGTMAAMTSRILETRKERILVILLLALGVPCSAQLGVILGILHEFGAVPTLIWLATVLIIIFIVGKIAEKLIPGENSDFIMELPPVRLPQFGNIAIKTLARIEWYIKEAVPLFILGTFTLFVLDKTGALVVIQKFASPVVVGWLQLPIDATQAFIIGFLRRDYGAAGLFTLAQSGALDTVGVIVSMVTITLFIPCIANLFMIVKELGAKTAAIIVVFVFTFAFFAGGVLNYILRGLYGGL